jgi:hypothetical protein
MANLSNTTNHFLSSLSASDFQLIQPHLTLMELKQGVTRTGEPGRGKGFRPIFVGLANLSGALRFRSGDHAYIIDGQKIDTMYAKTAQKVPLQGFLISVACPRGQPVGPS